MTEKLDPFYIFVFGEHHHAALGRAPWLLEGSRVWQPGDFPEPKQFDLSEIGRLRQEALQMERAKFTAYSDASQRGEFSILPELKRAWELSTVYRKELDDILQIVGALERRNQ